MSVLLFTIKSPFGFLRNWFRVLMGSISWVGLSSNASNSKLKFRNGVLSPLDALPETITDATVQDRLNALYAKEYKVYNDARIISKGWRKLGRELN